MAHDENPDTYERFMGPVRCVVQRGRKVPLTPPLPGETEPFAWTMDPDTVVSMDLDGRHVTTATVLIENGRGVLRVKFEDGETINYDRGPIRGTCDA